MTDKKFSNFSLDSKVCYGRIPIIEEEERGLEMSRYYEGRFNPYNRHDTGMYCVYRKSDGKYLGTVVNCHSEWHAKNVAFNKYGCHCDVDLIEE